MKLERIGEDHLIELLLDTSFDASLGELELFEVIIEVFWVIVVVVVAGMRGVSVSSIAVCDPGSATPPDNDIIFVVVGNAYGN